MEVQIKKKNKIRLVKDQGWYSEAEMRTELKWSALEPYISSRYNCRKMGSSMGDCSMVF